MLPGNEHAKLINSRLDYEVVLLTSSKIIWSTVLRCFCSNVSHQSHPVRSANVAIDGFTSARVSGNFMGSLHSSYRPLTTFCTASITADFPTLNAGPILEYEFPWAR